MAYKNQSSYETTIRGMMKTFPNDNWDIDRILYYCIYENAAQVQCDLLLNSYREYFEEYLEEIEVDPKYYYEPAKFAEDFYGDAALDFLVLYFAEMSSAFEFKKPKIKVLKYSKLADFNKMVVKYKTEINGSKTAPKSYSASDLVDERSKTKVNIIRQK